MTRTILETVGATPVMTRTALERMETTPVTTRAVPETMEVTRVMFLAMAVVMTRMMTSTIPATPKLKTALYSSPKRKSHGWLQR